MGLQNHQCPDRRPGLSQRVPLLGRLGLARQQPCCQPLLESGQRWQTRNDRDPCCSDFWAENNAAGSSFEKKTPRRTHCSEMPPAMESADSDSDLNLKIAALPVLVKFSLISIRVARTEQNNHPRLGKDYQRLALTVTATLLRD